MLVAVSWGDDVVLFVFSGFGVFVTIVVELVWDASTGVLVGLAEKFSVLEGIGVIELISVLAGTSVFGTVSV